MAIYFESLGLVKRERGGCELRESAALTGGWTRAGAGCGLAWGGGGPKKIKIFQDLFGPQKKIFSRIFLGPEKIKIFQDLLWPGNC